MIDHLLVALDALLEDAPEKAPPLGLTLFVHGALTAVHGWPTSTVTLGEDDDVFETWSMLLGEEHQPWVGCECAVWTVIGDDLDDERAHTATQFSGTLTMSDVGTTLSNLSGLQPLGVYRTRVVHDAR